MKIYNTNKEFIMTANSLDEIKRFLPTLRHIIIEREHDHSDEDNFIPEALGDVISKNSLVLVSVGKELPGLIHYLTEEEFEAATIEEVTLKSIPILMSEAKAKFITSINMFIELEVSKLNVSEGVNFDNIHSVKLYAITDGYPLQDKCKQLTDWSMLTVWPAMRTWQASLTNIPTEEEFITQLGLVSFQGYV